MLANATAGPPVTTIAADLVRILAEREPRPPQAWRPLSDADPALLALVGPWYWGPDAFVMRLHAGRILELAPLARAGRRTRLRAQADGTWSGMDGYFAGETLRIGRDPHGTVTHLDFGTFVFTRRPYDPEGPVPGGVAPGGWRTATA